MKVFLDPSENEELKKLVSKWVEAVPNPNEAIIGFAGEEKLYSAADLAKAVNDETDVGKQYIQSLAKLAVKDLLRKTFR